MASSLSDGLSTQDSGYQWASLELEMALLHVVTSLLMKSTSQVTMELNSTSSAKKIGYGRRAGIGCSLSFIFSHLSHINSRKNKW